MKKTIKSDKLITIMTEFEIEQSKAWYSSHENSRQGMDVEAQRYNDYADGIGHCLKELEELLK